jgi:isopentenyl-diphosphate delta-isomerase
MDSNTNIISQRKKEHLELCSTDDVAFKHKSTGFEYYEFIHYAATEIDINKLNISKKFFEKTVSFPFVISCMTGGTDEANNINLKLAEAAKQLNIPLGLGSLRYALNTNEHDILLKKIREQSAEIPIMGNIGAAQIIQMKDYKPIQKLTELIDASAFVIHINPLQELLQKNGEPCFNGLLKKLEKLINKLEVPIIIKEVGSGIDKDIAKEYLEIGVKGIDVAGAGGTSWAGVEILRNKENKNPFWDWGLPTSYCIREIKKLKKNYYFTLIGSGGINNSFDAAKAIALGSDFVGSARKVLQILNLDGIEGVIALFRSWAEDIKKIMYLTSSASIDELNRKKLIKIKDMY